MMPEFSLASPFWLLLFPVLGFLFWLRLRSALPTSDFRMSRSGSDIFQNQKTWRMWLLGWLEPMRWLALALFCLAMCRPQRLWEEQIIESDGIDIMLAMDISPSMLTKDFQPDRLTVAKKLAVEFIDKRPYDRLGLVAFSAEAFTQCPLTTDRRVMQEFVNQLEIGKLADGTAIGMGLATAVNRLKDSPAKSKVVILLTDGENNAGYIQPLDAAEIAKTFDIRVYTIGIGSDGLALSPAQRNPFTGEYEFSMRETVLDSRLLEEIAAATDGKFFRAFNEYQLTEVYSEIDKLERSKIEVTRVQRKTDYFHWLVGFGLLVFCFEFFCRLVFVRSLNF